jgi:hypothetical protein
MGLIVLAMGVQFARTGFERFSLRSADQRKQRDTAPYILAARNCLIEPREV